MYETKRTKRENSVNISNYLAVQASKEMKIMDVNNKDRGPHKLRNKI